MSNIFFCSDHHIGHKKAAEEWRDLSSFEYGPQTMNLKDHNQFIMDNHNDRVTDNDEVWFLGDVIFQQATYLTLLHGLRGKKNLVLGNHEHADVTKYTPFFKKICAYSQFGEEFIMSHIPLHRLQMEKRFTYNQCNVHGHIHVASPELYLNKDPGYFNVNIEFHSYKPIELSELRQMIRCKQKGGWNEYDQK